MIVMAITLKCYCVFCAGIWLVSMSSLQIDMYKVSSSLNYVLSFGMILVYGSDHETGINAAER